MNSRFSQTTIHLKLVSQTFEDNEAAGLAIILWEITTNQVLFFSFIDHLLISYHEKHCNLPGRKFTRSSADFIQQKFWEKKLRKLCLMDLEWSSIWSCHGLPQELVFRIIQIRVYP